MISFVYFDVGGVVIKDFSKTHKWDELWHDLGISPSARKIIDQVWEQHESELCISRDVDTLLPIVEKRVHLSLPANYSLAQDVISRFEPNSSIWPIVADFRQTTRVGLLTNMYPGSLNLIQQTHLFPPIVWDSIIDSSVVGYQKPNPNIFKLAQQKAGVNHKEILFVENSPMHIDAAKKLGWQTFLYDSAHYDQASRDLAAFWHTITKAA